MLRSVLSCETQFTLRGTTCPSGRLQEGLCNISVLLLCSTLSLCSDWTGINGDYLPRLDGANISKLEKVAKKALSG